MFPGRWLERTSIAKPKGAFPCRSMILPAQVRCCRNQADIRPRLAATPDLRRMAASSRCPLFLSWEMNQKKGPRPATRAPAVPMTATRSAMPARFQLRTAQEAVAVVVHPREPLRQARHLWLVGLGWLALTVRFEFSFGLLRGQVLAQIFEAYTFAGGNPWPLVLAVTALAPWLGARLRGWR